MPLKDLGTVFGAVSRAASDLKRSNIDLPPAVRKRLAEILPIRFTRFSAERNDPPRVFIAFDWFFIGAVLVPLYRSLLTYKAVFEEGIRSGRFTKEDFDSARGGHVPHVLSSHITALDPASYSERDKERLRRFISDYDWWHGSKTIDRGDFHVSSLGQAADILAASASFLVEGIVPALADNQDVVDALLGSVTPSRSIASSAFDPVSAFATALRATGFK